MRLVLLFWLKALGRIDVAILGVFFHIFCCEAQLLSIIINPCGPMRAAMAPAGADLAQAPRPPHALLRLRQRSVARQRRRRPRKRPRPAAVRRHGPRRRSGLRLPGAERGRGECVFSAWPSPRGGSWGSAVGIGGTKANGRKPRRSVGAVSEPAALRLS